MQYIRIYACGLYNYGWTLNRLKSSNRLKQEFETKNKYKFCLDFIILYNSTLKCKNHAWNILNSRLIYNWIRREYSDNKCVIFKELEENERT